MRVWSHLSEGAEDATHPESPTLYGGGAELRRHMEFADCPSTYME